MGTLKEPIQILNAKRKASDLIAFYGIESPDEIRLEDIAFDQNVKIVEGSLEGASARLVSTGTSAVIRVNNEENYPFKKRFSIAHELGHFVMRHGHLLNRICNEEDLFDWYGGSEEAQANAFAGELLLPGKILKPYCDVDDVSFDVVREISGKFQVSLTPTATRFIENCPGKCALVFSQNNKIKWFKRSDDWNYFLDLGRTLEPSSVAAIFFRGDKCPQEQIEVPGHSWVGKYAPDYLIEHTIYSKVGGYTLTILWEEI